MLPQIDGRYWLDKDGNLYTNNGAKKMSNNYKRNGYISNTLTLIDGTRKQFHRHRLMLLIFAPIKNFNEMRVNHKDGNKLNNKLSNLEWTTPKENTTHAYKYHLCENNIGEKHYNHKLTGDQVFEIYELSHLPDCNISELSRIYGVSRRTIGRIRDGESWKRILSKEGSTTISKESRS